MEHRKNSGEARENIMADKQVNCIGEVKLS
jgi:hypothetical protein